MTDLNKVKKEFEKKWGNELNDVFGPIFVDETYSDEVWSFIEKEIKKAEERGYEKGYKNRDERDSKLNEAWGKPTK